MKITFSMLLLVTACASSHSANQAPQPMAPIAPGDRLRVTHDGQCCASPSVALEQSLTRDSLVLQSGGGAPRLAIARSNITRIERWNQGKRHKAIGGVVGFFTGAVLGGEIGYQGACGHCDGDWRPFGAIAGAIVGGGAGLVTGVLLGMRRHGFWETVPF
jgi:hypothetical protein